MKTTFQLAQSWDLWREYIDPDATMTEAEFDAMTVEQRIGLIKAAFDGDEDKDSIIRDDANWGDLGHESVESQRDYMQQISDAVADYPGYASQVNGGWVWIIGSNEQRWSKRLTQHECERVVYEVVERLGIEDAFDLYINEEGDK